ncbi:hypothetical protein DY000_02020188 [Brassica cretica]|uniref:Peptidase A2 domain-containing protein n=1 Tax=Brassica cretica TaxID=69181 RepID=A0ABQ7E610_BRACR|nr:hypothetical protein DY000_02020188 [Brassica cretica]
MKKRITLKKKSDPEKFAIPCTVKGIEFPHSLCDTGASVSILPRVLADHLCDNPPFGIKWSRSIGREDWSRINLVVEPQAKKIDREISKNEVVEELNLSYL